MRDLTFLPPCGRAAGTVLLVCRSVLRRGSKHIELFAEYTVVYVLPKRIQQARMLLSPPVLEVAVGMLSFSAFSAAIHVAAAIGRRRCAHHKLFAPVDFIGAMQVWNYLWNIIMQGLVFPSLFLAGWARAGFAITTDHGLFPNPARPGYLLMRCWLYSFVGHNVADLCGETSQLIMLHHVACVAGVFAFLCDPRGGTLLAAGPFALEFGSLFFTAWCVDLPLRSNEYAFVPCWPRGDGAVGRAIVPWAYYLFMTFSNVAALLALGCVAWANAAVGAWGYVVFFGIVGAALLPLRHQQMMDVALGRTERPQTRRVASAPASKLQSLL